MNLFQPLRDYQEYIYGLSRGDTPIESSTLVVVQRSALMIIVKGELRIRGGYRLVVEEHLSLDYGRLQLERYGYEVYEDSDKLYWYDSQPHPNNPDLALNHPHHKHIPPDIKHNRIPAPNLPFLISEIEQTLLT